MSIQNFKNLDTFESTYIQTKKADCHGCRNEYNCELRTRLEECPEENNKQ